jgi:hypothetical protein
MGQLIATSLSGRPMSHLVLAGALLFALLAIVGIAIGACLGIARDLMLDGADDDSDEHPATAGNRGIRLPNEFGVGLRRAANFAQERGGSFRGGGSRDA